MTGAPEFTTEQHALRVAIVGAFEDLVEQGTKQVRESAKPVMANTRNSGLSTSVRAKLDDGTDVGVVSITKGGTDTTEHADAIDKLARLPHNKDAAFHNFVEPHVLDDPRVVALIGEHFPELVQERLNPAWRARVLAEAAKARPAGKGNYLDPATGEVHKVSTIKDRPADGRVSYTGSPEASAAIFAALGQGLIDPALLPRIMAALPAPSNPPGRVFPMSPGPDPGWASPDPADLADVAGESPWDAPAPEWDADDPFMGVA